MTLKPTQHHTGLWATSPNEFHASPAVAAAALGSQNVHIHLGKPLVFEQRCERHALSFCIRGLISELRDTYKEQLCFPPPCSVCLVHCVLCLPINNASQACVQSQPDCGVFLCATKAQRITARRQEAPLRLGLNGGSVLSSRIRSLAHALKLDSPSPLSSRSFFACMEGPLLGMKDMSRRF